MIRLLNELPEAVGGIGLRMFFGAALLILAACYVRWWLQ